MVNLSYIRNLKFSVVLVAAFSLPISATAASVFSVKGYGLPVEPLCSTSVGMGGASIAFVDRTNFSLNNVATLGGFSSAGVTANFAFESLWVKDSSGDKDLVGSAELRFFELVIPLAFDFVMGTALYPYTSAEFQFRDDVQSGELTYKQILDVDGGVNAASVAVARRLNDKLVLGAGVDLLFGSLRETWSKDFSSDLYNTRDVITCESSGRSVRLGAIYSPNDKLDLGISYKGMTSLKQKFVLETLSGNSIRDTEVNRVSSFSGIGFCYRLGRLNLAGDFKGMLWSRARRTGPGDGDFISVSLGTRYIPEFDPERPYYSNVSLAAGLSSKRVYFEGDSPIDEFSVSFGASFPFKGNMGALNISLEIGNRGSISRNGAEEFFVRESISVSGWEEWFKSRK